MLVLEQSQELSVPMPVTESAYAMLTAAKAQGLGDLDVAAIVALQERMSGMDGVPVAGRRRRRRRRLGYLTSKVTSKFSVSGGSARTSLSSPIIRCAISLLDSRFSSLSHSVTATPFSPSVSSM